MMNTVFEQNEKPKIADVFREKSVIHLAPLHYLRGIVNGCFAMATVMFIANVSDDVRLTAPLAVILSVGTVLSGVLYLVFIKKMPSTIYTIIGGIVTGTSLIIMATTHNAWIFYPVYFVGAVGMYFIDNSIPIFISEFVSGKIIGGYTTIRMLITTFGMATGNMLVGIFSENNVLQVGVTTVGIVAILMGFVFNIYDKSVVRKRGNQNG
jgi:MFS family permease